MSASALDDPGLSGVAAILVRYAGVTRTYTGPFTVTGPIDTQIECSAVDRAGNRSEVSSARLAVGVVPPSPAPTGDPGDSGRWSWRNDGAAGGVPDADIDLVEALPLASQAETVTVAFVGAGVYGEDPDLKDRLWLNQGEIAGNGLDDDSNGHVDDVHGVRFDESGRSVASAPLWSPADGWRPTGFASVVAAEQDNGYGISGVAHNAELMLVPVTTGYGWGTTAAVDAGVRYAVDNGADIIQMAVLGGSQAAIDYAAARDVLVVAPADYGPDWMPAAAEGANVVVVGQSDRGDQVAGIVGYGPHVDLMAPATAPAVAPPRYAGLYVDHSPYQVAYVSVSAERAAMPARMELIGEALKLIAPDKSAPVLVVDGTYYRSEYEVVGSRGATYRQAALANGYTDVSVFPGPAANASQMAGKTVIYCSGVDYPHFNSVGITIETLAEMRMFLDGGGSLLFVSGELGMYRGTGWVNDSDDFFGRYLHTMYLGTQKCFSTAG